MANPTSVRTSQDPNDPGNQVNPIWAQQMATMQAAITQGITHAINPGVAVANTFKPEDRSEWCTPEEAKRYDSLVEKDFLSLDQKTRKPTDTKVFYRLIHWFPEFQTSNSAEFKGKFAIEKWQWDMGADGIKRRKVITNLQVMARQFLKDYKPTIPDLDEEGNATA